MRVVIALFSSLVLVAVSMMPGWAHVLEMPAKMQLSRDAYFAVQQIYRGWAWFGLVMFPALAATVTLAALMRGSGAAFYLSAVAACCVAAALLVFFTFTFPMNQVTANWTVMPDNWAALRRQWEYSHAAGAALYFAAFVALSLAAVTRHR